MDNDSLLKDLDDFGLNNYEARVYSALFKKKMLSAAEVARLAGIPRTRAYDNLKSLELKGLCEVISDKKKMYSAVNPNQLAEVLIRLEHDKSQLKITKYKEEIAKEKDRLVERTQSARKLAKNLMPLFENGKSSDNSLDYVEVYKNPLPVHRKLIQLYTEAQREILMFVKPPFASRSEAEMAEVLAPQIEAIERGVKLRTIHEIPANEKDRIPFFAKIFNTYESDKEDLRVINHLPMKLVVFDGSIVLFSFYDPIVGLSSLSGFVAENVDLAMGQRDLFNLYWDKADELEIYRDKYGPR